MRTKPDQKKISIVIICIFLVLTIVFVFLWYSKFKDSEIANNNADDTAEAQSEQAADESKIKVTDVSYTMYTAEPKLTVRAEPYSESEVISAVTAGDEIAVTGLCQNGWCRVETGSVAGYCFGKYLFYNKDDAVAINKADSSLPYYITVNRSQNIVTVYSKDSAGEYTVPLKAMVCSVGTDDATPKGTYNISDKFVWAWLSGDVCGQYATRITGPYLFHSVPYFSQSKSDLEYEEYNKLGSAASLGCVRMAVIDVKWIYENCPEGTTVTIYDSLDPEPLPRPEPIRIDLEDERRGWDPTDPDPKNPWQNS